MGVNKAPLYSFHSLGSPWQTQVKVPTSEQGRCGSKEAQAHSLQYPQTFLLLPTYSWPVFTQLLSLIHISGSALAPLDLIPI